MPVPLINIIASVVLIAVLGGAVAYIIKAKKSGKKCIGCPDSASCSAKANGSGSCCYGCLGCSSTGECPSQQKEN